MIDYIECSRNNTYLVIGDQSTVAMIIRHPLLSDVMYDHNASQLVRAEDLASEPTAMLFPDELTIHTFELFQAETDDCVPVITLSEPYELLGVVRRSDVMDAFITQRHKRRPS